MDLCQYRYHRLFVKKMEKLNLKLSTTQTQSFHTTIWNSLTAGSEANLFSSV